MKKYCLFFLLVAVVFTACKPAVRRESRTVFALGTVCSIQVVTERPQSEVEPVLQACTHRLEELERHLSANAENSTLIDINNASGVSAVGVPADVYPLFKRAAFFAEKTGGAFNPVIGSVVKLWNIGFENARKPEDRDIRAALFRTDYKDLELTGSAIFLKKAGMKLDLGAIAKGFAADELSRIVKQAGIAHALIDIGGTISTVGKRSDGNLWKIGIRDPRVQQGQPIISVPVENLSISTSGSYERYFEQDGVRYHHILDPATGYPVRNNLTAVSVFSHSATDADALSTACFVLGYERAVTLLSELSGTEALFIFDDNTVRMTDGLKGRITILDSAFRLIDANEGAVGK